MKLMCLLLCLVPTILNAQTYSQDSGTITSMYVSQAGSVAVKLDGGFPNASSQNQCATANTNGWSGNSSADPVLKSALLAAKSSKQPVVVTTLGCEGGGTWYKIIDIYIN